MAKEPIIQVEEDMKKKIYPPIKAFNDHPGCQGHANFMLDCTYETKEERNLIKNVVSHYIRRYEVKA